MTLYFLLMKGSFMTPTLNKHVLFLIFALVTVSSNVLYEILGNYLQKYITHVIVVLIILSGLYLIIKLRQQYEVNIHVDPLSDPITQKQHAQRRLILFLSIYRHCNRNAITIGAVLASFHKDEDIEYVEANYDPKGEPTGPSFPLLVKYKPELVSF